MMTKCYWEKDIFAGRLEKQTNMASEVLILIRIDGSLFQPNPEK